MSLILNGTDGLSDVDGSAFTPAIRGTDTNTGIFFPASDTIAFAEGGAEVARFDSSGKLGINTTTIGYKVTAYVSSEDGYCVQNSATGTSTGNGFLFGLGSDNNGRVWSYDANNVVFGVDNIERMRITSEGRMWLGASNFNYGYSGYNAIFGGSSPMLKLQSSVGAWDIYNAGSGNEKLYFAYNTSDRATINQSTGAYTAVSDRNKKKDFEDSLIGLDAVMQLKPKLFRMLEDAENAPKQLGFIAQDVENVIPQAYIEEEGGMGGTFIGLQDRPFIAVLTKAIQEQQAIITDLKSRIETLEAK